MATRISCVVELTQRLGSTARWNRRCNGGVLKVTLLLSPLIHDRPDDDDCELSEEEDCSSHDKTCHGMRHKGKMVFCQKTSLQEVELSINSNFYLSHRSLTQSIDTNVLCIGFSIEYSFTAAD